MGILSRIFARAPAAGAPPTAASPSPTTYEVWLGQHLVRATEILHELLDLYAPMAHAAFETDGPIGEAESLHLVALLQRWNALQKDALACPVNRTWRHEAFVHETYLDLVEDAGTELRRLVDGLGGADSEAATDANLRLSALLAALVDLRERLAGGVRALMLPWARCDEVISDYGAILEDTSRRKWGVPDDALPHPRRLIKQAIRQALLVERDPARAEQLRVGFLFLGNFLPGKDGAAAVAVDRTYNPGRDAASMEEKIGDPEWMAAGD